MGTDNIIKELVELANMYDAKGEFEIANILDKVAVSIAKKRVMAKRLTYKERKEVPCIFPARHPKVKPEPGRKSKRGHFPIPDLAHARNAIQRVEAYDKAPAWWDGTLEELKSIVYREVYKKFPGLKKRKEEREKQIKEAAIDIRRSLKPGDVVGFERELQTPSKIHYSSGFAKIKRYDPEDDLYWVEAHYDTGAYNDNTTISPEDIINRYCIEHGLYYPLYYEECPVCMSQKEKGNNE